MASFNTAVKSPNLDQLSKSERGMFVKEHEFEKSLSTILAELNSLIDTTTNEHGESNSSIGALETSVSNKLKSVKDTDLSNFLNTITSYLNEIAEEKASVESAFETIVAKIRNIIQVLNINLQNRTISYDTVSSYKSRILNAAYEIYGPKENTDPKFISSNSDKTYYLRDVDEAIGYKTISISIDPKLSLKNNVIKICSFDPLVYDNDKLPVFLAECIISGDLYAYKGIISSSSKDKDGGRTVVFDADYLLNQDFPFSIKALKDRDTNKIVLALSFDNTSKDFSTIVKFDFSINLLVGSNLHFSPNNTIIQTFSPVKHGVRIELVDLEFTYPPEASGRDLYETSVEGGKDVNFKVKLKEGLNINNNEIIYSLPDFDIEPELIEIKTGGVETRNFSYSKVTDVDSENISITNVTGPTIVKIKALTRQQ